MQEVLIDIDGNIRSINNMIVRQYNNPMNDIWDDGSEELLADSPENITELIYINNRMTDVYGQDGLLKQEQRYSFFYSGSELKCFRSYFIIEEKLFVLYIEDRTDLNEKTKVEIRRKKHKISNIKTEQGLLSSDKSGIKLTDYIWMISDYLKKK